MRTRLLALDVDDAAHLQAAYQVARECELINDGTSDVTLESITAQLTGPVAMREAQELMFDGQTPVGLLGVENEVDGREMFIDVYALGPQRRELLDELLERGLAHARTAAAADVDAKVPDGADSLEMDAGFWQVTAATYTTDQEYADAIVAAGFTAVRTYWRMVLDLGGRPRIAPQAPDHATKRVVDGESDQRLLLRLRNESFADHFGETFERGFEDYLAQLLATEGCDPSRWWIAESDGQPVGLCILDDSKAEFGESYVRTLGVIPSARGRGIARWLLQCAASDAVVRGRAGLALTVDGRNTTGATRLYESVGFRTRQQLDLYCYPLV
ncbi:MAG: GNAT family N-acetyltransferase [Actinobacteria bacterium]|nr:GNAT family N-acetyltransferase [Actinomycetota bacterium]